MKKPQLKTTLTWKQRVMAATTGRNSRGAFLWYSHNKIMELISEAEGFNIRKLYPHGISLYISGLVKSGHLERALKPPELTLMIRPNGNPEYYYRQTGKPYSGGSKVFESSKNKHSNAAFLVEQGFELRRLHRKLPKWFRRMMMD